MKNLPKTFNKNRKEDNSINDLAHTMIKFAKAQKGLSLYFF